MTFDIAATELREGMEASIAESCPSLAEMRAWVDRQDGIETGSAKACREINGTFEPQHLRSAAISHRLICFLDQCILYREDLETFFRAKAHQQRRRA